MTKRAFGSQLTVAAASLAAFALGEASVIAARSASLTAAGSAAAWGLGLWALPVSGAALLVACLLAALCGQEAVSRRIAELWSARRTRHALLLAITGAALLGGEVFGAANAVAKFHNRELAAALLATSAVAALVVLSAGGYVAWRVLGRRRADSALLAVALLGNGSVWTWVIWECRSGLAQLDARLLAAPLGGLLGFWLADRSALWRARASRVLAGIGGVLASCWVSLLVAPAGATGQLVQQGAWSRMLVGVLQAATDFDGDGYSSLLAGGDCEPFDRAIHPRAPEIAGDGIDNNCIGGDGGEASSPRRPAWGESAHGSPSNLNIVIVTIETLRRDHASFVGARRDTTPNLRGLASSSLVFERMYSAAPYTRLALASLFSSYAPSEIDWLSRSPEKHMRRIAPATPWLPELLRERGYETIAVLCNFSAFTSQENIGFERGFSRYDVSTELEYRGGTMRGFPAAEQVDKALGYAARARRPFLLWLHLFEPHYRYEQPPGAPVFGADEQSRYDAEIWHVDQQLGRFFDGLRELGVWDSSVLFVTGDHGEAFGEHDDRWHGTNLFDPSLRPAALLRVPGIAGKRVDLAVTFTDIAPTLARVVGDRQTFDQLRGRSLAPLMHHRTLPEGGPGFVAETFDIEDGRAYQAALVAQPLKLVYTEQGRSFVLFDLATDPGESRGIDPASDPRAAPLMTELVAYLERARPRTFSAR